ncbi:MAG TPA: class I SAM-dependent methyltransferase [Candidatus Saccharimonadales bacterium]|nr:class I SAM-dependent methyltransferase [Candidatus Saccharimonadales bacterium]
MPETHRRTARRDRGERTPPPRYLQIDFEREFEKGRAAYDRVVGEWWRERSEDRPHALAYRNIASFIGRLRLPPNPVILDYACGHGSMLLRLYKRFPNARLIGVDGSSVQIEKARNRLRRADRRALDRVRFIESHLPDFSLPRGLADLVVFTFPQIVASPDEQPYYDKHGYRHPVDRVVGKALARMREPDPEDETGDDDPDELFDELMTNRVVGRNMRQLVRDGGLCVRVEYSNSIREGLTQLVQDRTAFEEGSLDRPYAGRKAERYFEYLFGDYHRSRVIEDVYHQTRDRTDMEGGYMTAVLRAL